MAVTFDALTSKIEHTTDVGFDVATLTILAWVLAAGVGEATTANSVNRAFQTGSATGAGFLGHPGDEANKLLFGHAWSLSATGLAQWTVPATDGQWHAIGAAYDRGSAANDPTIRVDFAAPTVTEKITPSGTVGSPSAGYVIGNNAAQTRTWDGRIAHLQFFDVILTADEMDAGLRRPGSIRRGLLRHWLLLDSTYTADYVGGSIPTATALATIDGPPCAPLWPGRAGFSGPAPAPPPSSAKPWDHYARLRAA